MGVWKSENTVITEAGLTLLAGISGKRALELTRAAAGSDYTAPSELAKKTGISHIRMEMGFSEFGEAEDGTAYVDVYLENSAVEEGFYHQQIGLYARDAAGGEILFLAAQADSPDYIPPKDTPVYITHRIFLKFSGNSKVEVTVDFSGIVTQEAMQAALKKKENAFDKNSAFNRNFSDSAGDYFALGKQAHPGSSTSVARADHVHPVGTALKYAENNWKKAGNTNLLPDTNTWVMSSGRVPDAWGGYEFEAVFTSAWEGFSCFFSGEALEEIRGKGVVFGVDFLEGASSRLELIVDGNVVNYILQSETAAFAEAMIPETASEVTLRIIIFSADDLHCRFAGVYMHDKDEEIKADDDGEELYLSVRKVLQARLPKSGTGGTLYLTEKGNIYLAGDDGALLPLAGSEKI